MNDDVVIDEQEETVVVGDDHINTDESEVQDAQETHEEKEDYTDEEKEEYGKRVQKRINQLNGKIHERDDIIDRQRADQEELRKKIEALESRFVESDTHRESEEIDSRLSEVQKRRVALLDDGDYENAIALDDELLDLKLRKRDLSTKQAKVDKEVVDEYRPPVTQSQMPDAQREWLNDNEWYFNPGKLDDATKANNLYMSMIKEGYDPEEPETYEELTRRLQPRPKPPPTSSPDRGRVIGKAKTAQMTKHDLERMRDFNLDPNNEKHRKAWLAEKRAT